VWARWWFRQCFRHPKSTLVPCVQFAARTSETSSALRTDRLKGTSRNLFQGAEFVRGRRACACVREPNYPPRSCDTTNASKDPLGFADFRSPFLTFCCDRLLWGSCLGSVFKARHLPGRFFFLAGMAFPLKDQPVR